MQTKIITIVCYIETVKQKQKKTIKHDMKLMGKIIFKLYKKYEIKWKFKQKLYTWYGLYVG